MLLSAISMAIQCFVIGFVLPYRARMQLFTQRFLDTHFGEEYFKVTKGKISKGGYPDMGSGRYSEKLSYEEWLYFNNA